MTYTKDSNFLIKWHPGILLIIPILFFILGLCKFEIGKEAYFYTLSTVAQSLAALIGIIAVFIIFKFDKLKSERKDNLNMLKIKINKYHWIRKLRHAEPPYSSLIKLAVIDSEEELFSKMVLTLKKIHDIDKEFWPSEFENIVDELDKIVKHINETDEIEKKIREGFNLPLSLGILAILLSILILPFGWIIVPAPIDFPSSNLLKMIYVGIIIYLASTSIFRIALLLDDILGLEFADRILEKRGLEFLYKYP